MNAHFTGQFFSGRNLASCAVEVVFDGRQLEVLGADEPLAVPLAQVRVSDRIGDVPRFLYLPDGASITTADNAAIDALLDFSGRARMSKLVHWLEQRTRVAVAATILLVVGAVSALWFGLPATARAIAARVPEPIERQAGEVALSTLDTWLSETQLSSDERIRAALQLNRMAQARGLTNLPRVQFRSMGNFPNAFALPGGTIVMSDELVNIATDDELAAVFAHEIAHWQLRHGLQSVLRGSAALLVVTTLTGDLSTLTTFAGTIPFTLLQRGYSREFEDEADTHAAETLRLAKVSTKNLATILAKIEAAHDAGPKDFSYLSTHPATEDRIKKFDPSGEALKIARAPVAASPAPPANSKLSRRARLDRPPSPVEQVQPDYPPHLKTLGIQGEVELEFVVDENGFVQAPTVRRSTHVDFEQPARDALMRWRFKPAQKQGRPVSARAVQSFHFQIEDDAPVPPAEPDDTR